MILCYPGLQAKFIFDEYCLNDSMDPAEEDSVTPQRQRTGKRKTFPVRYIYLILIVTIVVLLLYIFLNPFFVDLEGQAAPDFSIKDIDGNEFTLSENQGKVVVLDIMALSCSACKEEMKHLRAIFGSYTMNELAIVTISIDSKDSAREIDAYRTQYGDNWTFARDTDGVANKYKVSYIPTIVIIDKEGIIRYWGAGELSASKLSEEIDELL
jgi:peroxiredoxin